MIREAARRPVDAILILLRLPRLATEGGAAGAPAPIDPGGQLKLAPSHSP